MYYLIFLGLSLPASYLILFFFFPYFFREPTPPLHKKSLYSMLGIGALAAVVFKISFLVSDLELGNRILHAIGGGYLSFLAAFLAAKDSQLPIGKLRFFILSMLIVTALGVANELAEFAMQHYFNALFAETITDTWLDLTSNTGGALFAAVCFVPFVRSPKKI